MSYPYTLDLKASNSTNKVTELANVVYGVWDSLWLNHRPFYTHNLTLTDSLTNKVLIKNKDYVVIQLHDELSSRSEYEVGEVIVLTNRKMSDSILVEYHTLGLEDFFSLTLEDFNTIIQDEVEQPTWGKKLTYEKTLPVLEDYLEFTGILTYHFVARELELIRKAITQGDIEHHQEMLDYALTIMDEYEQKMKETIESYQDRVNFHASNRGAHNLTKAQIGLGSLENYPLAYGNVLKGLSSNQHYLTPLLSYKALTYSILGDFINHRDDRHAHNLTIEDIGLSNIKNWGMSNESDTMIGLSKVGYTQPQGVSSAISYQALSEIYRHENDTNNPHKITKLDVRLNNVFNYPLPTSIEDYLSDEIYLTTSDVKNMIYHYYFEDQLQHLFQGVWDELEPNPHKITKTMVGLDKVANYPLLPLYDLSNVTTDLHYLTPYRMAGMIEIKYDHQFSHLEEGIKTLPNGDKIEVPNPHLVKKHQLHDNDGTFTGEYIEGQTGLGKVANLKTIDLEEPYYKDGSNDDYYLTPLSMKAVVDIHQGNLIQNHIGKLGINKHNTKKHHIGLSNVDDKDLEIDYKTTFSPVVHLLDEHENGDNWVTQELLNTFMSKEDVKELYEKAEEIYDRIASELPTLIVSRPGVVTVAPSIPRFKSFKESKIIIQRLDYNLPVQEIHSDWYPTFERTTEITHVEHPGRVVSLYNILQGESGEYALRRVDRDINTGLENPHTYTTYIFNTDKAGGPSHNYTKIRNIYKTILFRDDQDEDMEGFSKWMTSNLQGDPLSAEILYFELAATFGIGGNWNLVVDSVTEYQSVIKTVIRAPDKIKVTVDLNVLSTLSRSTSSYGIALFPADSIAGGFNKEHRLNFIDDVITEYLELGLHKYQQTSQGFNAYVQPYHILSIIPKGRALRILYIISKEGGYSPLGAEILTTGIRITSLTADSNNISYNGSTNIRGNFESTKPDIAFEDVTITVKGDQVTDVNMDDNYSKGSFTYLLRGSSLNTGTNDVRVMIESSNATTATKDLSVTRMAQPRLVLSSSSITPSTIVKGKFATVSGSFTRTNYDGPVTVTVSYSDTILETTTVTGNSFSLSVDSSFTYGFGGKSFIITIAGGVAISDTATHTLIVIEQPSVNLTSFTLNPSTVTKGENVNVSGTYSVTNYTGSVSVNISAPGNSSLASATGSNGSFSTNFSTNSITGNGNVTITAVASGSGATSSSRSSGLMIKEHEVRFKSITNNTTVKIGGTYTIDVEIERIGSFEGSVWIRYSYPSGSSDSSPLNVNSTINAGNTKHADNNGGSRGHYVGEIFNVNVTIGTADGASSVRSLSVTVVD